MGQLPRKYHKPSSSGNGVYLHVYNHCVEGSSRIRPLGEAEKDMFVKMISWYLIKYNIHCLSYALMDNHYHMVLYTENEKFSTSKMVKKYKRFTKGLKDLPESHNLIKRLAENSNNISEYMRELQRAFSLWFNKTREFKRRGTLWEQRFKSTKLVGAQAVDTCIRYVEMNPVRAGVSESPSEYRYCSYGAWARAEYHPFHRSVKKYYLPLVSVYLNGSRNMYELQRYMERLFVRVASHEKGMTAKDLDANLKRLKSNPHKTKSIMQKSRYWLDGSFIGSKEDIKEMLATLYGTEKSSKRYIPRSFGKGGEYLYSLRFLKK